MTKVYARVREDQTIFHTHKSLQILDREWRLRPGNGKLGKTVPTLSRITRRFNSILRGV